MIKARKGVHERMKRSVIRCTVIASPYCTLLFISLVEVVVWKLSSEKRLGKILNRLGRAL